MYQVRVAGTIKQTVTRVLIQKTLPDMSKDILSVVETAFVQAYQNAGDMSVNAEFAYWVPREQTDPATGVHKVGCFTGDAILGILNVSKVPLPPKIDIDLRPLGFVLLEATRVSNQIVRMGQILQPGEGGHPADAPRAKFENCSECGGFNFNHFSVNVNA